MASAGDDDEYDYGTPAYIPEPTEFTYVLIPADPDEPCRELTAMAASFGDTLTELLKKGFAGGALTNMEGLKAEYGAKIEENMGNFQASADRGSVEVLALVKPSKTTLPLPMTGTYMYMDEMGALKDKLPNTRAFELANTCGLALAHPLPGDIYIGRVSIEPQMCSTSFTLGEMEKTAPWVVQAPAENIAYNQAMQQLSALKEKQVGYMTEEEKEARDVAQGYRWAQTEDEVEITVYLPEGTTAKGLNVSIGSSSLKVALKSEPAKPLVDLKLFAAVRMDDSTWTLGNDKQGRHVQVTLEKVDGSDWPRLENQNK
jgi:hypothetical protein